jgi:serine/threonine protein kinase
MLDDLRPLLADVDEDAAFLIPGARFGRYTLVRRLAIGGMAEIHLARASGISGFEKLVVLKRILPQFAVNEDFVEMFLDEARLAASLDHANIVQVYDVGQVGRSYFMAMEYLQGQDVRNIQTASRRHGRSLSIGEALSIAIPTAAGLHYAHEKRGTDGRALDIVHRDVSPANVIVTRDGCVKLVDFGIAKSAMRNTQTRAGTLKGKISYMSPEQCRGETIDRRSDVFALGIMLYELICGVRPFNGDNEYAILSQIIGSTAPAPSLRDPEFPAELERILLKALQPRPQDRYPSTRELQADLEAYARVLRLEVGPMVLAQLLEELKFTYRTDAKAQLPEGVSLPQAPLDDELAYSLVMAADPGSFDDGPSARLDHELLPAALPGRTGSRAHASTPAEIAHHTRSKWLLAGAAALVLAGIAIGATFSSDRSAPGALPAAMDRVTDVPAALPAAQITAPVAPRPALAVRTPDSDAAVGPPAGVPPAPRPRKSASKPAPAAKPAAKESPGWDPDSPLPPPH